MTHLFSTHTAPWRKHWRGAWLAALGCAGWMGATAHAGTGLTTLPATAARGPVSVYYPTTAADEAVTRGPITLSAAPDGTPERGNGRLIVFSHGSGASPWVYADLARHLVAAGYIVALPEHQGDNWQDLSKIGPESWMLRPREVSAAIDALVDDPRFAPWFDARRVGAWGMSAGGHTTLTLAGGRWSRARQLAHCEQHLAADFAACTGGAAELTGGALDGLKQTVARAIIRWKLSGDTEDHGHTDARIRAIVAGVPWAADFDPASLARPVVPLGLIQARGDIWLRPQFHSGPVMAACRPCEVVADLPTAGHGALLSPLPPQESPRIQRLIADPPGFDRAAVLPGLHAAIRAFFDRHLLP